VAAPLVPNGAETLKKFVYASMLKAPLEGGGRDSIVIAVGDCGPMGATMYQFLKTLSVLALGLSIAGCVTTQEKQLTPNVVPIDTTGNFGAR
jgi:Ni,Fe-hydrogenase III small subunit